MVAGKEKTEVLTKILVVGIVKITLTHTYMPTPLKTLLKLLGLSDKEAHVYLSSLRLGEASVVQIAHSAKLQRTSVASILDRLRERGLISLRTSGGRRTYWIEDPHVLVQQQQARLQVVEQVAARLHSQYHQADKKPTAEVIDTPVGLKTLITKVIASLKKGDEILTFEAPNAKHYQAIMTDELFQALADQKDKKGVRTRSLIPAGHEESVRAESLEHNIQVRVLPPGVMVESSFWMFKNTLVLFSGTHTFAVRISHRHMKESMASLFEMAWAQSQPIG